jgi:hypothetical protein
MRLYWIIAIGHLLMTSPLSAQGAGYCAQFSDGSSADCGFSTLQMCEQSVTGVGGVCIDDPSGPAPPAQNQTPYNSSAVSPPPFAQQSSSALQLPDPSQPLPPPLPCNPVIDGTYCASQGGSPVTAQSPAGVAPMQSLSSDLAMGGDPPATLGAISFSGAGSGCIGLLRRMACGG